MINHKINQEGQKASKSTMTAELPAFAPAIAELEAKFSGQLIRPDDADYEQARRLWNGRIDKYPALIARCRTAQDVVLAVDFARDYTLTVAVRGGAHNTNGFASVDSGLVIDLSAMKGVQVDLTNRTALAEPGVKIGEFIQATQQYGLIAPTGICSDTGISGSTLGGGIGWLMGKHGLAIDNVLSFELVTADGRLLKASATENVDLFWGLRGGGGNFGIVTAFEFQLHALGQVLAGMVIHPLAKAKEVLDFYRDFSSTIPDNMAAEVFLATVPEIGPAVIIMGGYFGEDLPEGERLLAPLRQFGPPLVDLIQLIAYPDFVAMLDPIAPVGRNYYESAYSVKQFSDEAFNTLITRAEQMTSPFSATIMHHVHGAATQVAPGATAFALREPHYIIIHSAGWEEGSAEPHVEWVRTTYAAMQPFASPGLYVNFIKGQTEEAVRASYRTNYDRLAALKHKYDPTNFFRLNQNIKPKVKN
ncbi:MAG: FAD-binding oxidoreductase [Anaerolineae bacterium]|nr:FAD-binding oxidoreductase [Anaerolineae bacterium]